MNYEEIAAQLGVSRRRVMQIEEGALKKLRNIAAKLYKLRDLSEEEFLGILKSVCGDDSDYLAALYAITMSEGDPAKLESPSDRLPYVPRKRMVMAANAPPPMRRGGPQPKLDEDKVRGIRRDREAGMIYKDLAAKYGVSLGCVCHVVARRAWWWVQ